MTEQQRYTVLETVRLDPTVELREYAACTVADVVVQGDLERAANAGFGPLVSYISGHKLSMTAPVLQEPAPQPGSWLVSFVLPGGELPEAYPLPEDSRVGLREFPAHRAMALRWSGRWTEGALARRTRELLDVVAEAGLTPIGEVRWARYDPPWTPPFMRRNEVIVTVS